MDDIIKKFIWKCADVLRSTSAENIEIYELLITLIFWKYISDNYENEIGENLHYDNAINTDENDMINTINNVIRLFIQNGNNAIASNITELRLRILRKDAFVNIYYILDNIYHPKWKWTRENTLNILDILDELYLESSISAHGFLTPKDVVSIMLGLIDSKNVTSIYDPFCRTGEFLNGAAGSIETLKKIKGYTNNSFNLKISYLKAIMLKLPNFDISQNGIGDIHDSDNYDLILTNPPFGPSIDSITCYQQGRWSRAFGGIKMEIDFTCHVLDHFNKKSQAAIIVPQGMLYSIGKTNMFRQQLISENILEAIIQLPSNSFYQTKIMTAILVLNANKSSKSTLLFDGTRLGIKQKERHLFSEKDISIISNTLLKHRQGHIPEQSNVNELSIVVSQNQFAEKNYSFQFIDYDSVKSENVKRRKPEDILKDFKSIHAEFDYYQKKLMTHSTNKK